MLDSWNSWNRGTGAGLPRDFYVNRITGFLTDPAISIVIETGIRRAGKSFIAKQVGKRLVEEGFPKNRILIINLEDERLIDRDYRLLLEMYDAYKHKMNPNEGSIVSLDLYFFQTRPASGLLDFTYHILECKSTDVTAEAHPFVFHLIPVFSPCGIAERTSMNVVNLQAVRPSQALP